MSSNCTLHLLGLTIPTPPPPPPPRPAPAPVVPRGIHARARSLCHAAFPSIFPPAAIEIDPAPPPAAPVLAPPLVGMTCRAPRPPPPPPARAPLAPWLAATPVWLDAIAPLLAGFPPTTIDPAAAAGALCSAHRQSLLPSTQPACAALESAGRAATRFPRFLRAAVARVHGEAASLARRDARPEPAHVVHAARVLRDAHADVLGRARGVRDVVAAQVKLLRGEFTVSGPPVLARVVPLAEAARDAWDAVVARLEVAGDEVGPLLDVYVSEGEIEVARRVEDDRGWDHGGRRRELAVAAVLERLAGMLAGTDVEEVVEE
ncbi:hypothetical protein H9P43_008211 [Blastocladiella emersonii ATCC 22665]|nr:hypothetical protein H9P43_008211 [Blastocladiella emersonii ATCC 22665]